MEQGMLEALVQRGCWQHLISGGAGGTDEAGKKLVAVVEREGWHLPFYMRSLVLVLLMLRSAPAEPHHHARAAQTAWDTVETAIECTYSAPRAVAPYGRQPETQSGNVTGSCHCPYIGLTGH